MCFYIIQVDGSLNLAQPLRQANVQKIGTNVLSLRVINDELYCCTLNSIEVYSHDLQLQRSITSSSGRRFHDVAEKDKDHVFVATHESLFVFTKPCKNIALFTS